MPHVWLGFFVEAFLLVLLNLSLAATIHSLSYSQFKQLLRDGKIEAVTIMPNEIRGKLKEEIEIKGKTTHLFTTVRIHDPDLVREFDQLGLKYSVQSAEEEEARKAWQALAKKLEVQEAVSANILYRNPFVYEGKTIAVPVDFETMESVDRALFRKGDIFLVSSAVPRGQFTSNASVILVGQVLGKVEMKLPLLGSVQVPHLKFVGAHFCKDASCSELSIE
jgi:hypothetical protein